MIDDFGVKWAWVAENVFGGRWSRAIIVPTVEVVMKVFRIKPGLTHLEIHLVDHCNLNCKACDHLSPIADKWFANIDIFRSDLEQLDKLFSGIHTIYLLGGEPLLHPDVESFLFIARKQFPNAKLVIMTNGLLLDKMPDSFWKSCKDTSTKLIFDVYPPLYHKEKQLLNLVKSKGVNIVSSKVQSFQACLNLKGDSDPNETFKKCCYRLIHQLKEGKIYTCAIPMVVQYFNKRFGTQLPSAGWINIYTPNLTGWGIKKALDAGGFSTCAYCSTKKDQLARASFKWSTSSLQMSEWESATYK
jgi:organic radical activating enzyme